MLGNLLHKKQKAEESKEDGTGRTLIKKGLETGLFFDHYL
jgi:hypothetical protein